LKVTARKAARILKCALLPNRPHHVQWLITRRCNYRCRGCNVWREQNDIEELTTDEIKKGLDILRGLGTIEIVFSGGAPLLREDIDEILEYASRYFVTTVYDNGSLVLEKIDALRNVDFVAISLDSLNPKVNDYIKGVKGSWKKAMEAIETLHEEGISVCVSPTISQLNLYEIVDYTKHFLARNIPVLYCLYSYDLPVESEQLFNIGRENDEFKIVDRDAMVKVCDELIQLKKNSSRMLITIKTLEAIKQLFLTGERIWKCRALSNFFMIDHLGRVAGCHIRGPVTTIFELPEVWDSKEFDRLRSIYRECKGCTYLCYIFYSIHSGLSGNFEIVRENWKNAKILLSS